MKEIITDNSFKQIVNEYTRITETTKSLIDWVITNKFSNIEAKVDTKCKISDHETVIIIIKGNINKPSDKVIKVVKYNTDCLRAKINFNIITNIYYVDCNMKADIFSNNLHDIVKEFNKEKKLNNSITNGIRMK